MINTPPPSPLSREERLRRVVIFCSDFTRNFAYYRAGLKHKAMWEAQPFWRTVSNNFLDHCGLEWCKLFVERKGKHCWRNVISDANAFESSLLRGAKINAVDFQELVGKIRRYRDKFVAHLDLEIIMDIPELEPAWRCVLFYHEYVLANETRTGDYPDLPNDLLHYLEFCTNDADKSYQRIYK